MKTTKQHELNIFLGLMVILVSSLACSTQINQPDNPTISPEREQVTPQATLTPIKIIPTATMAPTATMPVPVCSMNVPFVDDTEFIDWFSCVITRGDVEELSLLIPVEGIVVAPSNMGCPSGDCFPFITADELIQSIYDAQLTINPGDNQDNPVCFGYTAFERQVTITYRHLFLSFIEPVEKSVRGSDGYEFVFWRKPEALLGYEMSMVIGVRPEFIEEHRGGSTEFQKICP